MYGVRPAFAWAGWRFDVWMQGGFFFLCFLHLSLLVDDYKQSSIYHVSQDGQSTECPTCTSIIAVRRWRNKLRNQSKPRVQQ